jgi:RNA polymerase sigma-70 factor (ECF subfamily)
MDTTSDWQTEVLKHGPWLQGLISLHLREPDAVADVLQETLSAAMQHEERDREDVEQLRAWLGGVARNKSRQYIRAAKRNRHKHRDFAAGGESADAGTEPVTPLEYLLQTERLAVVRDALAGLPADDAVILRMKYLERLDYEQIGARLELNRNAVANRLRRARNLLRQSLNTHLSQRTNNQELE